MTRLSMSPSVADSLARNHGKQQYLKQMPLTVKVTNYGVTLIINGVLLLTLEGATEVSVEDNRHLPDSCV